MKTKEQIIRRMKSLSKEHDNAMAEYNKMRNRGAKFNAERNHVEKYILHTLNSLRVLSWVCGIGYKKFIKNF